MLLSVLSVSFEILMYMLSVVVELALFHLFLLRRRLPVLAWFVTASRRVQGESSPLLCSLSAHQKKIHNYILNY